MPEIMPEITASENGVFEGFFCAYLASLVSGKARNVKTKKGTHKYRR